MRHCRTEVRASPKFGLVRHVAERASPIFAAPFPYIPVYIVTYDVIFWSVNLRKIITDKVNVGVFMCDVSFSIKYTCHHADAGADLGFYKGGYQIHLKGAPPPNYFDPCYRDQTIFLALEEIVGARRSYDI